MIRASLTWLFIVSIPLFSSAQSISQWRGPNRDGVFPETGLMKSWPEQGPELLWSKDGLGRTYSTVSVTEKEIFVTGRKDTMDVLTVLDLDGNQLWELPYGRATRRGYPSTRCTPTVDGDRVYLISGVGDVVCINRSQRQIEWSVPAYEKFQGKFFIYAIAESPLLVDGKVIYTPGGFITSMVALDKLTGQTVWQTESLMDSAAFVSPILIEFEGRKIIVQITAEHFFGVDADNGKILWKVKYAEIEPPTLHPDNPKVNCITPLYHDGHIYITSGYDHVGLLFKLINDGNDVEQVWLNRELDCHFGQVVRIGDYIYGSNWLSNHDGNWCCVDWNTGKTMYEIEWKCKGSISAADGLLYCYEERRGNVALVEPTPDDFKIISSFQLPRRSAPHWCQPVIANGVLYIRHGNLLYAYSIKE